MKMITLTQAKQKQKIQSAFADQLHRQQFRHHLLKFAGVLGGVICLIGVFDYVLRGARTIHRVGSFSNDLFVGAREMNPAALVLSCLGIISLGPLPLWVSDYIYSRKIQSIEQTIDYILSLPNGSIQFYRQQYEKSGYDSHKWEEDLFKYLETQSRWLELEEEILSAIESERVNIETTVPRRYLRYDLYSRPTLKEILKDLCDYVGTYTIRDEVNIELPKQMNQGDVFLQGWFIDTHPYQIKQFHGLEQFVLKAGSLYFIGSIGPDRPIKITCNKRETIKPFFTNTYYAERKHNSKTILTISEGTYPYERGGVASVLQYLISELMGTDAYGGEISFESINLSGPIIPDKTEYAYELPGGLKVHPPIVIHGYSNNPAFKTSTSKDDDVIRASILGMEKAIADHDIQMFYMMANMVMRFSVADLTHSVAALTTVYDLYNTIITDKPSFNEFLVHWRSMRQPLFRVIKSNRIEADLYYTVVSGLGAVYSALCKTEYGSPIVMTEHGIYLEDRIVELNNMKMHDSLRDLWINTFQFYAKIGYDEADIVTTLCTSNQEKQLRDGLDMSKSVVIPNGIRPLSSVPKREEHEGYVVGFLGNIQPVKRVEIFVKAANHLLSKYPLDWEFRIMGREDPKDPSYTKRIHELIDSYELGDKLILSPYTNYVNAFSGLDVGVLTSSSEVMSLSIMEALSIGLPVVGIDVGANRELIVGDDEYGLAGILLDTGTESELIQATADAILTLRAYYCTKRGEKFKYKLHISTIHNILLNQKYEIQEIGPLRIKAKYRSEEVIPQYKDLYERAWRSLNGESLSKGFSSTS